MTVNLGDVRLLKLRSAGMFSNVNEVVEQLRLAEKNGYRFAIDWTASCYLDPSRAGDPWSYYFEPCFADLPKEVIPEDAAVLPGGPQIACTRDNIITPREQDGNCDPLLLPRDRAGAHALIQRYLWLAPGVRAEIDRFRARYFTSPVIGLHIRGPGRVHGGALQLRQRMLPDGGVPLEVYFDATDTVLRNQPRAMVFACSDSSVVIEAVQQRYGDRVFTYAATRSAFGEMHAAHPENAGQSFVPYKLGLDVLVEASLLAQSVFFVHGNSNVANFVLCKSPDLPHHYVYG